MRGYTNQYEIIELVSGAISMGLGGYLAAKSEADHYHTEREREGITMTSTFKTFY